MQRSAGLAALEDRMKMQKGELPALRPDPNRAPTHPGAILRLDVLPAIGEPVMTVAKKLGVTRQHLHKILAETAPVSPEMAVRLGKFCGNGPGLWLALQQAYDLWHASEKLRDEVERIPTVRDAP
jgi:addiction module HigA family antidote